MGHVLTVSARVGHDLVLFYYKNVSMKREISILSSCAVEVLPKAKATVTAK